MSYNPLDLSQKTILVTGASSGIGRAVAVALDKLGATLVLNGRRQDALEETRAGLSRPASHRVEAFDLSDLNAIPGWIRTTVVGDRGRIDGLVHSAGVGGLVPLRIQSRESMERVMVPNLFAALALLRGASAKVASHDGASFVFLSSSAASAGSGGLTAYAASKGGLEAAVRSAAVELKQRRLRVNCVAPAYVRTPLMAESEASLPDFTALEARQFLGILDPEEVAVAVAYLLSDAARRVTGSTLVIDAGFTC